MPKADLKAEESRVREMVLNNTEAIHRKDLDGYLDDYTEDATVVHPSSPTIKGYEQWRRFMAKAIPVLTSIKYDELTVRVTGSGDSGYVVGSFNVVEDSSQGHVEFRERLHATVVKIGGVWKYAAMSFIR